MAAHSRDPQPLPLDGAAWGAALKADFKAGEYFILRQIEVTRYFVAKNVMADSGERLEVLSRYFSTYGGADTERERLSPLHPQCSVISTASWFDPLNPAHEHARLDYVRSVSGCGEGLQ